MFERSNLSREDLAQRRLAKARWKAIQARMDERSYIEHLAMAERDEPLLTQAMHMVSQDYDWEDRS